MVGNDEALDQVLEAVANPHRRDIVRVLGLQPCAIKQLAQMRALSLPAIHKHLKMLEAAGLITRRKQGRTTYLTLNRKPLAQLQEWVNQFHPYWGADEATYENYAGHLADGVQSEPAKITHQRETMKKFMVLTFGFVPPTDDIKQAWGEWFSSVGHRLVDPGNPFGRGVELTKTARTELTLDSPTPLVGYCILNAESMEEAESLVAEMPIIESVRIYEAHSM